MKKNLLLAALLIIGESQLSAQCTIAPVCTVDPMAGYCTTPTSNSMLQNGMELTPYGSTIQISLGTTAFNGLYTIISASLTSVTGLPSGVIYSFNPSTSVMPAGSSACLLLSGTPGAGSTGLYTVSAFFDVMTDAGPFSQSDWWTIFIDPAGTVGIKNLNTQPGFFLSPNPASSELVVSSGSHIGNVTIVDALGRTVLTHDANYSSQTTININSLSKGVYFLQMNDASKISTQKFIKD
jgi:hypothetical protein